MKPMVVQSKHARIFETNSFADGAEIVRQLQEKHRGKTRKGLAATDIDKTVVNFSHTIGNDDWFRYQIAENKKTDASNAFPRALDFYQQIVKSIHLDDILLVEPEIPATIAKIQDQIDMIALTSRGKALLHETHQHLGKFGIDFNKGPFANQQFQLLTGIDGYCENGVFLTAGQNKGECVLSVLNQLNIIPSYFVMWDDRAEHLAMIAAAIDKFNAEKLKADPTFEPIEFVGLRYSHLDKLTVDPNVVNIQAQTFGRILPDDRARLIAQKEAKKGRVHHVDFEFDATTGDILVSFHKIDILKTLQHSMPELLARPTRPGIRTIHGKEKHVTLCAYKPHEFRAAFDKLCALSLVRTADLQRVPALVPRPAPIVALASLHAQVAPTAAPAASDAMEVSPDLRRTRDNRSPGPSTPRN